MEKIREMLETRKQYLSQLKADKEKALENIPDGSLRISNNRGKTLYYHRTNPKNFNGTYIREQDHELVQKLAQKDYDQKVLTNVEKELIATEKYITATQSLNTKQIYENMHRERQKLVTPIWVPDDEFVQVWQQEEYTGKEFAEGIPEFYTEKGERVRSKSEVIIADFFNKNGIPYRYEYPIHLKGVGVVYPDFMTLNIQRRKEIWWEHLGMMDDPNYVENAIRKIASYEQNGIFPGENLILTYETKKNPLNQKVIKMMIQRYLQ